MAEGDIGTVIESWDFDGTAAFTPAIIHITGNMYAIVYRDTAGDGQIVSFEIAPDGDIILPAVERYEFETDRCWSPVIIHISGVVYAICYGGPSNNGTIITLTIAADGDIGASPLDTFVYATNNITSPFIVHVSGSVYAIAYSGFLQKGYITTITINADGSIDDPVIERATCLPAVMLEPEIIHVVGDIYAVVYKGADDDGFLLTISIEIDGDIGAAVIDTIEFDTGFCEEPNIIHISGSTFAIVYKGPDSDGFLKTVSINSVGDIGASALDTFEFETTQGLEPRIIHVSGYVYSIAYTGPDFDGFIKTITIAANGDIGASALDTFEFDTVKGELCDIIHISGSVYAIAYIDDDGFGVLKTIGVETRLAGPPKCLPLMGIG